MKTFYNEFCKAMYFLILGVLLSPVFYDFGFRSRKPDTTVVLSFAPSGFCFSIRVFRVTAYCPCEKCCGQFADGITASGHKIQTGDKFVAASTPYPFGTLMFVPGYSNDLVMVQDRGSAMKGNRLDIFYDTHEEALVWGVKYLEVMIIK